jgi:hypothetical protein
LKKKLMFSLIAGALVVVSSTAGAFAASNMQEIKAHLNLGLKFKVDGAEWIPNANSKNVYPITYNGTTYLPIRTAGEALGVEVGWDGANNTVWLGEGAAAAEGREQKTFNVDVTLENGPMVLNVSKVTFEPSFKESDYSDPVPAIILDVKVENTSHGMIEWYVNQSKLVLNTKEQIEKTLLLSEYYVSSEFNGAVIKTGKIIFPVKSSKFEDITSIRLLTTHMINSDLDRVADEKEVTIEIK